jgi:hypothetical protein
MEKTKPVTDFVHRNQACVICTWTSGKRPEGENDAIIPRILLNLPGKCSLAFYAAAVEDNVVYYIKVEISRAAPVEGALHLRLVKVCRPSSVDCPSDSSEIEIEAIPRKLLVYNTDLVLDLSILC